MDIIKTAQKSHHTFVTNNFQISPNLVTLLESQLTVIYGVGQTFRPIWAMVVAQLLERSLPIPEVRCSNPVIGKKFSEHLFTVNCFEKTKIKEKRTGIAHLKIHFGPFHCNENVT